MRVKQRLSSVMLSVVLFAMPASTTYEMRDYTFGSGGVDNAESTSYGMNAVTGELSGSGESTNFSLNAGLSMVQQSAVPPAPTFSNDNEYYNKLNLIIATSDNPSDTKYAVAITSNNWVTTQYVKSNNTIGDTLTDADYQTYTDWGGATGEFVIDLRPDTTYKVKVKAMQGAFTETQFGPEATAATSPVQLTYDLDVSSTDQETSSPYQVLFGTLVPGSVTTATDKVWIDIDTNATQGAFVYVYANGNGLESVNAGHTISSVTGNLASLSEGFGVRSNSVDQDSGGPLQAVSPYNTSNDVVGMIDTTTRTVLDTSGAPISNGRASLLVKAKSATTTPAATDYTAIITMVASATF